MYLGERLEWNSQPKPAGRPELDRAEQAESRISATISCFARRAASRSRRVSPALAARSPSRSSSSTSRVASEARIARLLSLYVEVWMTAR